MESAKYSDVTPQKEGPYTVVWPTKVAVRAGPCDDAVWVSQLSYGSTIEVLEKSGEWLRHSAGWSLARAKADVYLYPRPPADLRSWTAVSPDTTDDVFVYCEPSVHSKKVAALVDTTVLTCTQVGELKYGDKVLQLGRNGEWLRHVRGWSPLCNGQFPLFVLDESRKWKVIWEDTVVCREGPSNKSQGVTLLEPGSTVLELDTDGDWLRHSKGWTLTKSSAFVYMKVVKAVEREEKREAELTERKGILQTSPVVAPPRRKDGFTETDTKTIDRLVRRMAGLTTQGEIETMLGTDDQLLTFVLCNPDKLPLDLARKLAFLIVAPSADPAKGLVSHLDGQTAAHDIAPTARRTDRMSPLMGDDDLQGYDDDLQADDELEADDDLLQSALAASLGSAHTSRWFGTEFKDRRNGSRTARRTAPAAKPLLNTEVKSRREDVLPSTGPAFASGSTHTSMAASHGTGSAPTERKGELKAEKLSDVLPGVYLEATLCEMFPTEAKRLHDERPPDGETNDVTMDPFSEEELRIGLVRVRIVSADGRVQLKRYALNALYDRLTSQNADIIATNFKYSQSDLEKITALYRHHINAGAPRLLFDNHFDTKEVDERLSRQAAEILQEREQKREQQREQQRAAREQKRAASYRYRDFDRDAIYDRLVSHVPVRRAPAVPAVPARRDVRGIETEDVQLSDAILASYSSARAERQI